MLFHFKKALKDILQHFKFVNWWIRGFVFWCHEQVLRIQNNQELKYSTSGCNNKMFRAPCSSLLIQTWHFIQIHSETLRQITYKASGSYSTVFCLSVNQSFSDFQNFISAKSFKNCYHLGAQLHTLFIPFCQPWCSGLELNSVHLQKMNFYRSNSIKWQNIHFCWCILNIWCNPQWSHHRFFLQDFW